MPFGPWKNWNACMAEMEHKYPEDTAKKVCGKLKSNLEKAVKTLGGKIPNHDSFLFAGTTVTQRRELKEHREAARQAEYPHNEDRAARDAGTPGKVDKADEKNRNQGMPTRYNLQMMAETEDYPKWQTGHMYKSCPCRGAKVEMEHAKTLESLGIPKEKIPEAAKKIAADHVKETEDYYQRLEVMERPDFWDHFLVRKADVKQVEGDEKEIRNLHLKSKLSPQIADLKEIHELTKDADMEKEWNLDLAAMLASDRTFTGTFHKPVIDKENDIIPAKAMDAAMDDFMVLPTLQEVHTERTVGIIVKAWKTGEDEYKFIGKIKPGDDCNDVWDKVKRGVYDGLSIGGRRIRYSSQCSIPSSIRTTPCVTHKLKLYNVSVCSSPVNPEATVDSVSKSEDLVFDLTETFKKAESAESITKGESLMADENTEGVSKSDELITKSDIAGLTKAVESLNKSFEHYFASLTTPQPHKLSGKEHSVENTMQKDEDPDPDEDPKRRMRKDEDPDPDEDPRRRMRKSRDVIDDVENLRKSFDAVIEERDDAIYELQEKISKMENTKIQKGGTAVIIPEQLYSKDPIITSNAGLLASLGRTGK